MLAFTAHTSAVCEYLGHAELVWLKGELVAPRTMPQQAQRDLMRVFEQGNGRRVAEQVPGNVVLLRAG